MRARRERRQRRKGLGRAAKGKARQALARPDVSGDPVEAATNFTRQTGVELMTSPGDCDGENKAPPEPRDVLRLLPTVQETLLMYPSSVRGGLLRTVAVYGVFRLGGNPYLGAARRKIRRIDLGFRSGTNPRNLAQTVHHEIGHLVEGSKGFPLREWKAVSGQGAYTGKGHRDAWGKGNSEALNAAGFVTRYASKNPSEDFAELAELAFSKPKRVRKVAAQHPRIAEKLRILEAWYAQLIPGISLPWR